MIKEKNELKSISMIILMFAGFSLVRLLATAFINGFTIPEPLPEGLTSEMAQIIFIVTLALGLLLLIPEAFVGFKGLFVEKKPIKGKAHIVWALIIAIFSAVGLLSSVNSLFSGYTFDKALEAADILADVILFIEYYVLARKIAKAE